VRKFIFALLALFPPLALAQVSLPFEEAGVLDNAPYRIKVPVNWNGTLLVYARGTTRTTNPVGLTPLVAIPGTPPAISEQLAAQLENAVLSAGYALAASALPEGVGVWSVREGIHHTKTLTNYFKDRVAKPEKTILWSRSQGTVVGLDAAEKYPGIYDGSIAGCAVGAGSPRTWDISLDVLLAWKTAFGFPASWGNPGDIRDNINFISDVAPVIFANLFNPANIGRFEFFRRVLGVPREGFYPVQGAPPDASWLVSLMFFSTEVRGEVETKANGRVAQNLDHVYTLTADDKTFLASLGVNFDELLAVMNSDASKFEADIHARNYNKRYAEYSGRIRIPVLTLHTTMDGLVFTSHESAYRETVEDARSSDMLVQVFAQSVGHCTFTPAQWLEAVQAMTSWLETGQRPGPEFFPDFDLTFTPPEFPNP
jgi:pimeloyl-ACP methyl ester carboxylesterase